jgi:hypothetical protein
MKTRLIFLVLLIVCFSCGTNNKPVSDAQKEKIKGEVKEVANAMFKGCEEANFDMATESFLDSPDFVYIYNGVSLNYKGVVDGIKPLFGALINQKVTITDEKYVFLDKSTVIYTTNCKFLENYKDGHAIVSDPMVVQVTFKKIDNKWKAINGVESSVRQSVKNTETSKELNQVELMKQFLGSWKCEIAKDTIEYSDLKSYGTGFYADFKWVSKDKIVLEGKQLYGYDKKMDKFILSILIKGMDIQTCAMWFTSKNICVVLPYSDISNLEKAPFKVELEFKSPDTMLYKTIVNNNIIKTDTLFRVKN